MLEARQSRSHEYRIEKGVDLHAIDVTVTIVSNLFIENESLFLHHNIWLTWILMYLLAGLSRNFWSAWLSPRSYGSHALPSKRKSKQN